MRRIVSDWRPPEHGHSGELARMLPDGFAAYARILHPFWSPDGEQSVSWGQVAQWSGRRVHRLAQVPAILKPTAATNGPRPTDDDEPLGGLSADQFVCLLPHLTRATERADSCSFGVWDGYAEFHEGAIQELTLTSEQTAKTPGFMRSLAQTAAAALFKPQGESRVAAVPPVTLLPENFTIPDREFYMFNAPLSIAPTFTQHVLGVNDRPLEGTEAPNIWWPDDEAWLISTDIDLASTYVGGRAELIEAILADPGLEAFPAHLSDSVTWDSDTVNQ